jgi:iron-sulfur cluster repair protein YtfE (RIC family)
MMVMNAVEFLIHEHRLLEEHFEKSDFSRCREELIKHVNLEEEIFYPRLLKSDLFQETILEAWEDHNLCMQLLQELDGDLEEKFRQAKFSTLKKLTLEHFKEEEEKLFPTILKKASPAWLEEIGEVMKLHKPEIEADHVLYPEIPGSHRPKL